MQVCHVSRFRQEFPDTFSRSLNLIKKSRDSAQNFHFAKKCYHVLKLFYAILVSLLFCRPLRFPYHVVKNIDFVFYPVSIPR